MLQGLQSTGNYELIHAARQAEAEAKKNLDEALQHAGPMAAAKRERDLAEKQAAEQTKREEEAQAKHASESKDKFREEAKRRYLAAGGTLDQFNHAFSEIWAQELTRRTLAANDTIADKLSARYAGYYHA